MYVSWLRTDCVLIVGTLRCVLERAVCFAHRHVCRLPIHTQATHTRAPINVHHGCVHTLRAIALARLRAGRLVRRDNVLYVDPHESGHARFHEWRDNFQTSSSTIDSNQCQLRRNNSISSTYPPSLLPSALALPFNSLS